MNDKIAVPSPALVLGRYAAPLLKGLLLGMVAVLCMTTRVQAQPGWGATVGISSSLYSFGVTSQGTVLVGTRDGIYRSGDDGVTFELVHEVIGPEQIVEEDGQVYVASTSGVFRSEDDGATWQSIMASRANAVWVDGSTIVAGGDAGGIVFTSRDAGATWTVANARLLPYGLDWWIETVAVVGDRYLFQQWLDEAYMGTFEGAHGDLGVVDVEWAQTSDDVQLVVEDADDTLLLVMPREVLATTDLISFTRILESLNTRITYLDKQSSLVAVVHASAATTGDAVAVSADGGSTFVDWTTGLDFEPEFVALAPDGFVYVAGEDDAGDVAVARSAQAVSEGGTVAQVDDYRLPDRPQLGKPYPNPLRQHGKVSFYLPHAGPVRIEMYDALGRRVAVLVDQHAPAGAHELRLSDVLPAERLSSGSYVLQMCAGAEQATQLISIVR